MNRETDTRHGRATRMEQVQAPIVPVVSAWIRETPGTISLGQGVVHYGPPPAAIEAVRAALGQASLSEYGDGAGLPALREAITQKLRTDNGIDVTQGSRVMVTAGANMAFTHAILATTSPGDEVILPVPYYFNHEMAVRMAGCVPVCVPTGDDYQLRLDRMTAAVSPRTRAIVTVSPNNPSGAVLTPASLAAVNALCAACGLVHISDEPYEYFTYGVPHTSPGALPGAAAHTISIYSLSKAYGFAGWRIGYLVYPESLEGAMVKAQDTILVNATIAAQVGATAALQAGRSYSAPHVEELRRVRDLVVHELSTLAPLASVPAADGAFYAFLRLDTQADPMRLAERLVREHRVAVIPGPAFGMTEGCYFRVAFGALQPATVSEGIGRLVTGLRALL